MKAVATNTSIHAASFWADMKPAEHLVQCWSHDDALLDALEGFAGAGLSADECVVVVGTAPHLHALEKRLRARWLDIDRARWERRYVPLLAQETLDQILGEDGMPDATRFKAVLARVLEPARAKPRKVRIFGEMVNVLCAQGRLPAAIALETLWSAFLREHELPLFCAYDKSLLAKLGPDEAKRICALHTLQLPG